VGRVTAGEEPRAVAVGDLAREQGAFAGERVDRLGVLLERMPIDGASVAADKRETSEQPDNAPKAEWSPSGAGWGAARRPGTNRLLVGAHRCLRQSDAYQASVTIADK